MTSRSNDNVLIVGGYGNVGKRIARLLADELGSRLLVGGRNKSRAERCAADLKTAAQARRIDVTQPATFNEALQGVAMVIMCLDTADLKFAHACVVRGVHWIDITASSDVVERLGFMQDLAAAHGVTILSSVGLAPGITNLLAKACAMASHRELLKIDIHILFGLGDHHGKAAVAWMVNRFHRPFKVITAQGPRSVRPFVERASGKFPAPFGVRTTYRFDFSDQHTLRDTLGVEQVNSWATFDHANLTHFLSRLAQLGVLGWTRFRLVHRLFSILMRTLRGRSSRFAVSVEAMSDTDAVRFTASGLEEAHATAVIAAETARRVLAGSSKPGVFQLDQQYSLHDFEVTLAENDIVLVQSPLDECAAEQIRPMSENPTADEEAFDERAKG